MGVVLRLCALSSGVAWNLQEGVRNCVLFSIQCAYVLIQTLATAVGLQFPAPL